MAGVSGSCYVKEHKSALELALDEKYLPSASVRWMDITHPPIQYALISDHWVPRKPPALDHDMNRSAKKQLYAEEKNISP